MGLGPRHHHPLSTAALTHNAPVTCAIDGTAHESLEALHRHLQFKLRVKQEVYYTEHAPRRDRHTGEVIPFKAPASDYLRREFVSRQTLNAWLKANPEEGQNWALDWLAARVAEKGLTVAPCQVELRSLPSPCPDVRYYEDSFEGGYAGVCTWAGVAPRFGGQMPAAKPLPCPVVIDTREQRPLELPCASVRGTLRSADYGLPAEFDQGVYIERKSLADMAGTLSSRETRPGDSNLARFTRELERVTEIGAYVVMLVECPLADALAYHTIPHLKLKMSKVRVSPEHVFHNLRDLCQRFPQSFQPLFVANRAAAASTVVRLLAAGEAVRNVDLQAWWDARQTVAPRGVM